MINLRVFIEKQKDSKALSKPDSREHLYNYSL